MLFTSINRARERKKLIHAHTMIHLNDFFVLYSQSMLICIKNTHEEKENRIR